MAGLADRMITEFDRALRTVAAPPRVPFGAPLQSVAPELTEKERAHSAALMRVNHVGEVCAQALYRAQAAMTTNPDLVRRFEAAAAEETEHLGWTSERVAQLRSHTSLLNPLWYAGAYVLGVAAARAGDALSLGFVVETERQVEQHLQGHLDALPAADQVSRALVARMRDDEARHGREAKAAGAATLPAPVRFAMRLAAKVMTTTAYWI